MRMFDAMDYIYAYAEQQAPITEEGTTQCVEVHNTTARASLPRRSLLRVVMEVSKNASIQSPFPTA